MAYGGPCELCGRDVRAEEGAHPTWGWEALRAQGGANRIIDRQRDQTKIAHVRCVEEAARRRRRGISDDQGELL